MSLVAPTMSSHPSPRLAQFHLRRAIASPELLQRLLLFATRQILSQPEYSVRAYLVDPVFFPMSFI